VAKLGALRVITRNTYRKIYLLLSLGILAVVIAVCILIIQKKNTAMDLTDANKHFVFVIVKITSTSHCFFFITNIKGDQLNLQNGKWRLSARRMLNENKLLEEYIFQHRQLNIVVAKIPAVATIPAFAVLK